MKQPKEYTKISKTFKEITNLNLNEFMDWTLSIGLNKIQFDISKYLNWCNENGMKDEESIAEFNIRFFEKGERLNQLIQQLF